VVLAVFVGVDALWFYAQGSSLRWTGHAHLHWAAVAICCALLIYFRLWLYPAQRDG
jgi:hypothetical protein